MTNILKEIEYVQYYVWWLKNCSQHLSKEKLIKEIDSVCKQLWFMDSDERLTEASDFLSTVRLLDYDIKKAEGMNFSEAIDLVHSEEIPLRFLERAPLCLVQTSDW